MRRSTRSSSRAALHWRQWPCALRNIARTAPYFHNGSVPTLDEAVRVMAKTQLDRDLTPEQMPRR